MAGGERCVQFLKRILGKDTSLKKRIQCIFEEGQALSGGFQPQFTGKIKTEPVQSRTFLAIVSAESN